MANKIKFNDKPIENYEPSDSDEEYTEHERSLLKKVRNQRKDDSEDEQAVLEFDESGSESDGNEVERFEAPSDIEDAADDDLPDDRAWGRKAKNFYSTDFIDPDYSSYNVREEEQAEQEEIEARAIQQRLAKQFNESDFTLNLFPTDDLDVDDLDESNDLKNDRKQINIQSDLSDLSHRQRVQLFKKDSPEFDGLIQYFEQQFNEMETILEPVAEIVAKQRPDHPVLSLLRTKISLILSYCNNVAFYLILKSKRIPIQHHPVIKRLVQIRQLLLQLEDKYQQLKPQFIQLLDAIKTNGSIVIIDPKEGKKSKKSIESVRKNQTEPNGIEMDPPEIESGQIDDDESGSDDPESERRKITYQMSKNKGLTPHRKKELRNPRVKHRNKYRKALIRRKGAVRTVRKELSRYGGEFSGIKATVKKGIKIK